MLDLFEKNIEWDKLGGDRERYRLEIADCLLTKDETLRISLRSNFVVPLRDEQKIRAIILSKVEELKGVDFRHFYGDMVTTEEETLKAFLPHMIAIANGDFAAITESIVRHKAVLKDGTFLIPTVGELACEELNKRASVLFSQLIAEHLGLHVAVRFAVDREEYETAKETLKEETKKEMAEVARDAAEAAKRAAAKPKKEASFGGGDQGGKPWRGGGRGRKSDKEAPANGNIIMGKRPVDGEPTPLRELTSSSGKVVVAGILFGKESKTIRSGNQLVSLFITDKKTSIALKTFLSAEKWEEVDGLLKPGDYIKALGTPEFDRFENELVVMIDGIEKGVVTRREDNFDGPHRVELHCHTKMSAMDGLNDVENVVKTAARWGQPAVAITDHGVVQSFPDAAKTAKKLAGDKNHPVNIKIIYGMEGYVFDDSDCHREDGSIEYKSKPTYHIILLAATQEGLKNLYKLVSISHLDYFYKRPRLPKSVISKYREGIIIGSACEAGEVYRAVRAGVSDEELDKVASFYDYLEIQPLINDRFMIEEHIVESNEDLKAFNRRILETGDRLGKLTVATTDAHYDEPESAIYRNIMMAGMGYKDAENGQGLYMRTTEEMLEEFSYLGERAYEVVVENTNKIADLIDGSILPVPKGKFPPKIDGAEETLRQSCMAKAHEMYGDPLPERIGARLEKELNSVISNGYAVMYVSAQMLVADSMAHGYLVGSRGSVGSSLAATMAGITEVNPLEPHYVCPKCKHLEWGDMALYDCGIDMPEKACPECGTMMRRDGFTIPFATFLGFNGDKEPDIDLNFAGEYQASAHKYVGVIFGEKNVFKAGTVSGIADKTAYGYVMKYAEEQKLPINKCEANRLKQGIMGVKRTTGQHPGGIVIVPDDHEIYEFCPVQHPANDAESGIITTHFDYHKIDENLLKLDILGHTIPSMIRQLQEMTGIDPLKADLTDRKVLSIFNGIEALDIKDPEYRFTHGTFAIPEFGTSFVRQMLDDTKPDKFADLVRISGFSHGTDVWLNNAQDYIRSGTATMREVISTRDDIMNYLILKGIENKTSFQIMEDVRKNRPLKEEQLAVMKEHGVPDWYIDSCIKIQYMFPRAHAVAYTMMSFRMAWYKVYYPLEFYATYFTSVADDFNPDIILEGPAACLAHIDRVADMSDNASAKEKDEALVCEVAYEMYARGYSFKAPHLGASKALKFWIEDGKVLLPFVALNGVGESAATAFADAYDEKPFDTVEEAINRAKLNKTSVEALRRYGVFDGMSETDQLSMFSMF